MKEFSKLLRIKERGLKLCRISTFLKNLLLSQQLTKLVSELYQTKNNSKEEFYPGYQAISNRKKRNKRSQLNIIIKI